MDGRFSLVFDDDIELCGGSEGEGFWFEALAEGTSWGDPQPVEAAVASLLADGNLVERLSNGNRQVTLRLTIKATDPVGVAQGRARLDRATGKRTTLVWRDGDWPATVFEVETSATGSPGGFNDLEYLRNEQTVGLTLECLPFTRSEAKVVDLAGTPPASSGTVLYSAESTTGWSTFYNLNNPPYTAAAVYEVDAVTFAEGAGSLKSRAHYWDDDYFQSLNLARNRDQVTGLSLSTGTGGYLAVSIRTTNEVPDTSGAFATGLKRLWMTVAGVETEVTSFASIGRTANGFVRYAWAVDAALTVTGLRFEVDQYGYQSASTGRPHVWYDDFELLPAATTDHQIVKNLTVQGSARTTASLRVTSASEAIALGYVLVATVPTDEVPAGFQPDGRRWVTQGVATTDTSSIHGVYYTPDTASYSSSASAPARPIFDMPVSMLTPGPYTVVALVKAEASTLTFGVQAQTRVGGTNTGPTSTAEVSLSGLATGWQFVTVGTLYLPPVPMESPPDDARVRLLFKGAKFADVFVIPARQSGGRQVADFSVVDCGTGTVSAAGASSSLWLDSPSIDQPQGGLWRGPTQVRTQARSAWPDARVPGVHVFRPGALTAFLVSTGSQAPGLTLEYHPRWLGHAAS